MSDAVHTVALSGQRPSALGARQVRAERVARRFEAPMLGAAGLVVPTMLLEAAGTGGPWATLAALLNWGIWLAFVGEAVVMLALVPDRWGWLRRHPLEVVVVVLTPPFVLAAFQPVRLLRLLRLVRLLRLAPLVRRLLTVGGLKRVAAVTGLTAVISGIAFSAIEKGVSLSDGMYWAVTTMTTVGYGDVSAHTAAGKALTLVVMFTGIGFVALLTGAIAQLFVAEVEAAGQHDVAAVERPDAQPLAELRAIAVRLQELEREFARRR